jgi:hypothetical protein
MKKWICWTLLMALSVSAALAEKNVIVDRSADEALITWSNPVNVTVGLIYTHLSRRVMLGNVEENLRGDIVDVGVGLAPWPWLLLYGQVGGSQARLDALSEEPSIGAGGLLGAQVNLWQLYEGIQATAWRLTLQVAGQYEFRTTQENGDGDLQWGEGLVMLPLRYHLSFARTFRNHYMSEFQSVSIYLGPAWSKLDGTWTRNSQDIDFEEAESFGAVGGADLWLLENLSFGVRADWFETTSMKLHVRYCF